MTQLSSCPDRQILARLLDPRTTEEDVALVEEHVLVCETCCQVLRELESADTFVEAARGTLVALPADEEVQRVMAGLKAAKAPAAALDETLASKCEATEDAWDLAKLLDPPEGEGELGRFGGYRVLRVLGAGGMGLVFEAEDPKLRRHVALKVMNRALASRDEHHQRFLREARAAAAIEHPHIVTVYQVGEHNGLPFLAMQLLKGESLDERLRRDAVRDREDGLPSPSSTKGSGTQRVPGVQDPEVGALGLGSSVLDASRREPDSQDQRPKTKDPNPKSKIQNPKSAGLPLEEVLRIGRETAEALAEAHQRNLIHRDIKPANIWLEGASGWVKLVDFGLAHAAEDVHLTQTGTILGTPAYMSPEQARGDAVDGRTDLYSLGAVLYKLTTGEVPFRGASTMAVLMALATETPRSPVELNPDIPPAFNDLILRLLAKKPDDRFASAAAVAEAILQIETSRMASSVGNGVPSGPRGVPNAAERGDTPARHRPRWPLVAAAAAAAFLLATIVIIVRDKDGKEVFRGTVPDGGSFTATAGDVATKTAPTLPDAGAPSGGEVSPPSRRVGSGATTAVDNISPPGNFPEPPPLEEWLKGRTVLTVAQDGSGQFTTIQSALDALRPGQVVRVLDRGPYREAIALNTPPENIGLISDQQSVVEISGWKSDFSGSVVGFKVWRAQGFRLSGFTILCEKPPTGIPLAFSQCGDIVVERCVLRELTDHSEPQAPLAMAIHWTDDGAGGGPACIRESAIEGALLLDMHGGKKGGAILARNYFTEHRFIHDPASGLSAVWVMDWRGSLRLSNNVIDTRLSGGLNLNCAPECDQPLTFVNNTILSRTNSFGGEPPRDAVLINNICQSGIWLSKSATAAVEKWRLGPNAYFSHQQPEQLPRRAHDIRVAYKFLSEEFSNREFARPLPQSELATRGADGHLPSYFGALPPGPAPKDGDWFTRLQERWTTGGQASPTRESTVGDAQPTFAEPPSLEEWLKGRTVLTVAQDGSGQFKTIQAALDALKAHQVVEVLDAGPYRETLRCFGLPLDTALVSRRQTTIEMPDEQGEPHFLHQSDGFRLSGFRFLSSPRRQWSWRCLVTCGYVTNLTVENCHFAWKAPPDPKSPPMGVWIGEAAGARPSAASVVRHCVFDSASLTFIGDADGNSKGSLRVEHNYFRNTYIGRAGKSLCQLLIRHNAIEAGTIEITALEDVTGILEISNNTITGSDWSFNIVGAAPKRGLTIRNNISQLALALQEKLRPEQPEKNWRMDHNNYQRLTSFPRAAGDLLEDPQFLSTSDQARDYLRIPADGPLATGGAGGDWPSYMGAFPPGPAPKEGDWFTRLRERWATVGWAFPTVASKVGNTHPTITEPPPLDEWLKGREVLTVAQDGSGKFKTIQAAFDALQPGQVVKVLDAGPYRERLEKSDPPRDSGIVSESGAVIELPEYAFDWTDEKGNDIYKGHRFTNLDGFRVAGFTFRFPPQTDKVSYGLWFNGSGGLVLERCWVRSPVQTIVGHADGANARLACVRECRIDDGLALGSYNEQAETLVTRNFFAAVQDHELGIGVVFKQLAFRGNVFAGQVAFFGTKKIERFEMSNNTFVDRRPLGVPRDLTGELVFCNNLRLGPGLVIVGGDASRRHFSHNAYPRRLNAADGFADESLLPRAPEDVLGTPKFISKAMDDRDYLRPAADDPIATAGAGGEWPDYIGALPPGPAPNDGDWFSRLRERWTDVGRALPTSDSTVGNDHPTIPEPPSLEEWLKDRTVLTVAQDGSGQFKTIQAALDALKPHQVVTILDSGPYRETLNVDGLPDDVGLISKRQATIELSAWPETPSAGGLLVGHTLNLADGFRLGGLRLVAPPPDGRPGTARMAQLTRFSGLVIEDCYFGWTGNHDLAHFAQLLQMDNDGGTGASPVVVRDCLFDSGGVQWDGEEWLWPGALVVERCFFNRAGFVLGAPQVHDVLFRHNVFLGGTLWVHRLKKITGELEISNNTALLGGYLMFKEAPASGITLRNNLTEGDAALGEEASTVRAEIAKNWRRDHNAYTLRKYLPKSPSDVTDASGYLSSDPTARDFARIPEAGAVAVGGAGGDWPGYIGALPPGPAPKEGDWFTRLRERWQSGVPADASLPRETIDVLATLDLSKDFVSIANLTGDNKWTKADDKLTYHSDGHSGKIVAPIDLADARDYVIQVDVRRLSGGGVFTLDFPTSATLGSGLDVFIGGQIELKLEHGRRQKIGEWPSDVKDAGQLFMRVRQETANRPGSVEVSIDGRRAAHWEGNVSQIGNPLESHPAFPGRMTLGLFCFQDSFEFTAWWLRVFDGHAQPLRATDNGN